MNIHFVKAYSRLGMINIPHGGAEPNLGVELGPDAVLNKTFLKMYKNATVSSFVFPLPEKINKKKYASWIAQSSKKFCKFINKEMTSDKMQVVVGGDHGVAFGSLLAVLTRTKSKIGYIQFDSHTDINLFKTSHTGNFHGMWLRPFFGDFDNRKIQNLIKNKLNPEQILFIGDIEFDLEEKRFLKTNKIMNIRGPDLRKSKKLMQAKVKKFISSFDHIHLSFDIDVFSKKFVRATGTPSKVGLAPKEILPLLDSVGRAKSLSIDLVEVNPKKPGARQTIALAQQVLKNVLKTDN